MFSPTSDRRLQTAVIADCHHKHKYQKEKLQASRYFAGRLNGYEYQFTPAKPGGRYWTAVPSEETKEAVEHALNGEDYSEGALYFASRKYANATHMSWFDRKLTWLFRHGNHEFYTG